MSEIDQVAHGDAGTDVVGHRGRSRRVRLDGIENDHRLLLGESRDRVDDARIVARLQQERVDAPLAEELLRALSARLQVFRAPHQHEVVVLDRRIFDPAHELDEDRVHEVGNDERDDVRARRPQRPPRRVRPVVELARCALDALPGLIADARFGCVAQHPGHGRDRDTGAGGDVAQSCHGPIIMGRIPGSLRAERAASPPGRCDTFAARSSPIAVRATSRPRQP